MTGWFANLTIRTKSALAPTLAILGLIAIAGGSVVVFQRLTQDFRSLNETSFARYADATTLEATVLRINAELYSISSFAANADDPALLAARIAAVEQRIDALTHDANTATRRAGDTPNAKAITATLTAYAKSARDMLDMTKTDAGMVLMLMTSAQDDFAKLEALLGRQVTAADHDREDTYRNAVASIGLARMSLLAAAIVATLLAVAATIVAIRAISRPIVVLTGAMTRLADGTSKVAISGSERRDELGAMARALEVFKANGRERARLHQAHEAEREARLAHAQALETRVRAFDHDVATILATVADAATKLDDGARSMSARAGQTAEQSAAVLAVANRTSANVQTITESAEALTASIAEIAGQVAHASAIAQSAVGQARRTNDTVEGLAATAQQIGEVVTLIRTIAGQTNLLALNATIEAARAGQHGKGFAVVASEVKGLAEQTAHATGQISSQIGAIQSATAAAVEAIRTIGATIAEVEEISAAIAGAVERQGAATREIAGNVQRTAAGTQEMSASMSEMNRASAEVGAASIQVLRSAGQLTGESATLKGRVETFLASVSAA